MQNCGNETLQKFLENLVEELKENNDIVPSDKIPFVIAALHQKISKASSYDFLKFAEFINSLADYPDYGICIDKPANDYSGICDITVNLARYQYTSGDYAFENYDEPAYHYLIEIYKNEYGVGYCMCRPGDEDYREDKHCCGHGCDWDYPGFKLHKVIEVVKYNWFGDEHDFWDFEDEFYKSERELNEQKQNAERELEIKRLQERMRADEQRLKELMEK